MEKRPRKRKTVLVEILEKSLDYIMMIRVNDIYAKMIDTINIFIFVF